jgi:hypothetical protein
MRQLLHSELKLNAGIEFSLVKFLLNPGFPSSIQLARYHTQLKNALDWLGASEGVQ